jgi:hypothetical protein
VVERGASSGLCFDGDADFIDTALVPNPSSAIGGPRSSTSRHHQAAMDIRYRRPRGQPQCTGRGTEPRKQHAPTRFGDVIMPGRRRPSVRAVELLSVPPALRAAVEGLQEVVLPANSTTLFQSADDQHKPSAIRPVPRCPLLAEQGTTGAYVVGLASILMDTGIGTNHLYTACPLSPQPGPHSPEPAAELPRPHAKLLPEVSSVPRPDVGAAETP